MTVSCVFGFTSSGKSYHVENNVLKKWDKAIIFDKACCFENGKILINPSKNEILKTFKHYLKVKKYRIIIRPDRSSDLQELLDRTILLGVSLGRSLGVRVPESERVQVVVDEADFVCTDKFQSKSLKHLVNVGRHDNVDSHFIARSPSRIHTDIRANSSKITTFQLSNAPEIKYFISTFGRENCKKIQILPKYYRFEWDETGKILIYDDKSKERIL